MLLSDNARDPEYADLDYQVSVDELDRLDPDLRQTLTDLLEMAARAGKAVCARLTLRDMMGVTTSIEWCSGEDIGEFASLFSALDIAAMRGLISGQPTLQRMGAGDAAMIQRHSIVPRGAPLHGEIGMVVRGEAVNERGERLRTIVRLASNALAARLRHVSDTRRLAAVYLASPTLSYLLDGSGTIIAVTELWLQHFGYRREEVIGRNARQFMSEEARREFGRVRDAMWRNGGCRDFPSKFVTQDGREVDVLMSASVEFNSQGWPINVKCSLTDITEVLRLQRELASSRRTDALTGACNGETFAERVALELSRARRHERRLMVAVFELRHFDVYAARHGAAVAGGLLASLVTDIRVNLRAGDEVGRIGGARFGILLAEVQSDGDEADVFESVTAVVHERLAASLGQHRAALEVCVGACGNHGNPVVEVILARANLALQRAMQAHKPHCLWTLQGGLPFPERTRNDESLARHARKYDEDADHSGSDDIVDHRGTRPGYRPSLAGALLQSEQSASAIALIV
ncbi:MAG: diguanylate cyclase [Burkholderiaceae bacterium]